MFVGYLKLAEGDRAIEFFWSLDHWGPEGFDGYWMLRGTESVWLVPQVGFDVN
jgi:hypothetical protein